MSFSGNVKEELVKKFPTARHCQMAELAGLLHSCGQLGQTEDGLFTLGFQTEKDQVIKKAFTLMKKTFNINAECGLNLQEIGEFLGKMGNFDKPVSPLLIRSTCCQRAFLRGAFLGSGSISDPQKGYHLEYVCSSMEKAEQMQELFRGFDIDMKIIPRKNAFVLYLKEGEHIVELLTVLDAPIALMELQNTIIYKGVINDVNRRMNCEMSNIRKTVNASKRQVEDIIFLRDTIGLENLPNGLGEMAQVRLEYPEEPLLDLGKHLDPPIGKSGVNHRLRKLSELAEEIRLGNK